VTPTLNRAALLERTIRSVRNQTYANFEHIVVDGGSSDATLDVLRQHEGTYPLRWLSEPDSGMYAAINKGMRLATGDIVAYLNSDDLYLPWALEVVAQHFTKHPEADFVFGSAISVDDVTGRQFFYFQLPFDLDYIQRVGFLCQPTVFWRRQATEATQMFDESLHYVADCDFWMRAGRDRRFVRLNEFVAVERNHIGTLRDAQTSALFGELRGVRSRYVRLSGPGHRVASIRHAVRKQFWLRAYWVTYALQSLLPASLRHGPWSRLINSGEPEVRWSLLLLRLIPGSQRRRPPFIRSSRFWLEPPEATEAGPSG
jgi:glycosyltransferase involved in cell wall biosynthesis